MNRHRVSSCRRFVDEEHGAALVEFAILAVVLLVLMFGIIEFGRVMYTKNHLTHAVRQGGRIAAVMEDPAADVDSIKRSVIRATAPLGGSNVVTEDQIAVHFTSVGPSPVLQSLTVVVTYPYTPITPLAQLIGLAPMTLRDSAQFRYELGG